MDKVSIVGSTGLNFMKNLFDHQFEDVLPFIFCCKGRPTNYDLYYERRPSDDGRAYTPIQPGKVKFAVKL